jgi:hypothetical protein
MNMKLRAIALIALMSVLTFAANAQATRADLPAPDNFLSIATFPLWDGDAPGALGKEQADVPTITLFARAVDRRPQAAGKRSSRPTGQQSEYRD